MSEATAHFAPVSVPEAEKTAVFEFGVSGMTCAGCAARLEKALNAVPGVSQASVNFALESARVEASEGINAETITFAAEQAGFGAHFADTGPSEDKAVMYLCIASALLTLPLVAEMLLMPFGIPFHLSPWIQLALATPVQFVIGWRFYQGAWASLRGGVGNMDVLVALGTSTAFLYSTYLTVTQGSAAMGSLYFEGAAVIITLVLLGKYLEARAKQRATSALQALLALRPARARLLTDEGEKDVPITRVAVGDLIRVRPGEAMPVDGEVTEGSADIDESMLTGESMPVTVSNGGAVIAGSTNLTGLLTIRATQIGKDTRLAKIAELVRAAQAKKAPVQKLVDRISAVFVPAIVAIAALTFIGWMVFGQSVEAAIIAAVSVLVIACPCALGLAAPAAIAAGLGAAARSGILVGDVAALERAGRIDTVVFDKTGTLTAGQPVVRNIAWAEGKEDGFALAASVAVQKQNDHPLARAFRELPVASEFSGLQATDLRSVTGKGVAALVDGKPVLIGKRDLLASDGIEVPDALSVQSDGDVGTHVWLAVDGKCAARVDIVDRIRDEAITAVAALHASGRSITLLSGDARPESERVAGLVGIDTVVAEVSPEDKAAKIASMQEQGRSVAMVGDGINDAPALAAADLGIAMGGGSDVAVNSAGITLLRDDPRLAPAALDISERTLSKIRQNLFWAFAYNTIGIPLAALGYLSPGIAGAAMALSSVCVVTNALLLRRWKPELQERSAR
ncbi:heavy metal translocating P-type ATPase [Hwanghaeella sp.]|uniref:heavy metal translocating P-type ATPase n=1 Tax=Hwanghaeella sp. TaxID=2605943 RepID=UPI003CCBFCD5